MSDQDEVRVVREYLATANKTIAAAQDQLDSYFYYVQHLNELDKAVAELSVEYKHFLKLGEILKGTQQ